MGATTTTTTDTATATTTTVTAVFTIIAAALTAAAFGVSRGGHEASDQAIHVPDILTGGVGV
jgi:hypothetical protein